jgi:hypothetical protein
MKFFDVEMEITYTKTLRVRAEDAPTAEMLAALVFMDTDAIRLTPADLEEFDACAVLVDGADDEEIPCDDDEAEDASSPMAEPKKDTCCGMCYARACVQDLLDNIDCDDVILCAVRCGSAPN